MMTRAQKHRPPFTHWPDGTELYMDEDDYGSLLAVDKKLRTNGFAFLFTEHTAMMEAEVEFVGMMATMVFIPTISPTKEHLMLFQSRILEASLEILGAPGTVVGESKLFDPATGLNFIRRFVSLDELC